METSSDKVCSGGTRRTFYRPQRSWGKVIFSQASVILLTGGVPGPGEGPPGPHPRGKLRGIRSRPTPKGKIEGDQVQAHTQGGN